MEYKMKETCFNFSRSRIHLALVISIYFHIIPCVPSRWELRKQGENTLKKLCKKKKRFPIDISQKKLISEYNMARLDKNRLNGNFENFCEIIAFHQKEGKERWKCGYLGENKKKRRKQDSKNRFSWKLVEKCLFKAVKNDEKEPLPKTVASWME